MNRNLSGRDPETLLPLTEAAHHLGIAYDTARKRLNAGTLRGVRRGRRWYVWVPVPDTEPERPGTVPGDGLEPSGHIPDRTDALIAQLRDEVAFLRDQARERDAAHAEEVRRRDHVIAGLIERLPALPSGQDAAGSRSDEPGATEAPASTDEARGWRAWLRRLWSGS